MNFRGKAAFLNAFTILELLVAITVLSLILVVMLSLITQTSNVWRSSSARIEAFQSARRGFETLTRSLEQVHEGMTAQSQGARQIRAAMESLRGDAAESATSLEAFAAALDAIRSVTTDLEAEVARFSEASR